MNLKRYNHCNFFYPKFDYSAQVCTPLLKFFKFSINYNNNNIYTNDAKLKLYKINKDHLYTVIYTKHYIFCIYPTI